MNRQIRTYTSLTLCVLTLVSGCHPTQPFFFASDGNLSCGTDLSHYLNVATDIEYPDVNEPSLDEVCSVQSPLTLANSENFQFWDIPLEEVTRIALTNSQVIRHLGGRITDGGSNIAVATPETLQQNAGNATTTYDPALVESGNGTGTGSPLSGTGVEAALSEFDAQIDSSITWQYNDRPQNFRGGGIFRDFFANNFKQDIGNFTAGITKTAADGTTFEMRNNTLYDWNNNGSRATPSDWTTNFEAAFTPLLQGRGTQYNRIAGPISRQQIAGGIVNQIDGVIISRIRHDITLTDFEAGVLKLMRDIEETYWELYFAYRDLEARKIGRDSSLETWRKVKALQRVGGRGGEADRESQARSQYFLFRSQVETALNTLFRLENRLRYMMGLTASDGRLLRPIDKPTTAQLHLDWPTIHSETLSRRTELRKQKWQVKKRELELIASRNHLMPRLDTVGRYRWLGSGNDLIDTNATGIAPFAEGSNAWESLVGGDYQEWEISLQFSMPLGFRQAMTGVRHHQLLLARERAVLQDLELEMSHQLSNAVRDIDLNFGLTQTNFNRRVAAEDEVVAVEAVYESGRVTLDLLLDAQRRRAEAESAYYRSLVDYNRAIMLIHYRKGSLLEYNGVFLAEGPWPGKANFDALRRARQRDASMYMDYGFTRPNVISRGSIDQNPGQPKPFSNQPKPVDEHSESDDALPLLEDQPSSEKIATPPSLETSEPENDSATGSDSLMNLPAADAVYYEEIAPSAATLSLSVVQRAAYYEPKRIVPNEVPPPIHADPNRQDFAEWIASTTRGLPSSEQGANPFRHSLPPEQTPISSAALTSQADSSQASQPLADPGVTNW